MKPLRKMSTVAGVLMAAGLAHAQVAPPPPAAPAVTPPFKAPEQPKPQAQPSKGPSPSQLAAQDEIQRRQEAEAVDFESIAVKDENGNIKPLPEPIEWYALKHNPIVKPVRLALCEPVLRERRAKYDTLVIDNIDIMEQLDSGVLEKLDMTNKTEVSALVQQVKPFQSMGTLTNQLKKARALEPTQAAVNQRIVNDYIARRIAAERSKEGLPAQMNREEGKEAAQNPAKAGGVNIQVRLMLEAALNEAFYFYHQLLLDAGANFDKLGITGAPVDRFQKAQTEDEKIDAVKSAMISMTLDQKREMLRKVLTLRPPLPPLPDTDKMIEEAKRASGVDLVVWRGPRELTDACQALHQKVKESRALSEELAAALAKASAPTATAEDKAALDAFKPKLAEAKAAEDAARKTVLDLVEKNPEYKVFLATEHAKKDGIYFPPPAKKSPEATKTDASMPAATQPAATKPDEKK